jgi:TRAP-type mannitol/chloroaromatic compound transport system substrate-binding protein
VSAAGLATGAVAGSAFAQTAPTIKWRLASSFPKSLDTLFGVSEHVAKRVAEGTDGKFQIQPFAAGELVPPFGVLDAVKDATVEIGHSASYYFIGKDPTFAFEGLKFRIGGFAGQVLAKLGVVPQQIPGADIYPSLEKGTIDAAEWVGPYDDQKLGFNKVAKYYYYPGWWEGSAQVSIFVNKKHWDSLPKDYQSILTAACAEAHTDMQAKYDARNPAALKQLVAGGAQLRAFPKDVMQACMKVAFELYEETAAKNENFKKIYEPWKKFRDDQQLWFRVAEHTFDNFVYTAKK